MARRNVPVFDTDFGEGLWASTDMPAANFNQVNAPILPSAYNIHRMDLYINDVYVSSQFSPFTGNMATFATGTWTYLDIPKVYYYNTSGDLVYVAHVKTEKRWQTTPPVEPPSTVDGCPTGLRPMAIHGKLIPRCLLWLDGDWRRSPYWIYDDQKIQMLRYKGTDTIRKWFINHRWWILDGTKASVSLYKVLRPPESWYDEWRLPWTWNWYYHPLWNRFGILDHGYYKGTNPHLQWIADATLNAEDLDHGRYSYTFDGLSEGVYIVTLNHEHMLPWYNYRVWWNAISFMKYPTWTDMSPLNGSFMVDHYDTNPAVTTDVLQVPWWHWHSHVHMDFAGWSYHVVRLNSTNPMKCNVDFMLGQHAQFQLHPDHFHICDWQQGFRCDPHDPWDVDLRLDPLRNRYVVTAKGSVTPVAPAAPNLDFTGQYT